MSCRRHAAEHFCLSSTEVRSHQWPREIPLSNSLIFSGDTMVGSVPHRPSGTLYVGHSVADLAVLESERATRAARGDARATMLSAMEAHEHEPGIDSSTAGALFLPDETVVRVQGSSPRQLLATGSTD